MDTITELELKEDFKGQTTSNETYLNPFKDWMVRWIKKFIFYLI